MRRAARPVTFALLIILLVYLPLMALEGVEGRMFAPMAITVALALGGALAFSLTAFPAMAAFVLTAPTHAHDENKGFFGRTRGALRPGPGVRACTHPKLTLGVAVLFLVASVAGGARAGRGVRPAPRRRRAVAWT